MRPRIRLHHECLLVPQRDHAIEPAGRPCRPDWGADRDRECEPHADLCVRHGVRRDRKETDRSQNNRDAGERRKHGAEYSREPRLVGEILIDRADIVERQIRWFAQDFRAYGRQELGG